MSKQQKGGLALVEKYGHEYMRELGRKGAKAFWSKYRLSPIPSSAGFAIVERATGKVKAVTNYG